MNLSLEQALQTLMWSIITGVVFAVFKTVLDRTIVKDLKRSDELEANLRKDVEENRLLITRLYSEMDKLKGKIEMNERIVEQELRQLKEQYTDIKRDMKERFDRLESILKQKG